MKTTLIGSLITALLKVVQDDAEIKIWIDSLLDKIEERVAASPNKFDDATILPLCNLIRKQLNVPDNDQNG